MKIVETRELDTLFREAQIIADELGCDSWQVQEYLPHDMGSFDYCVSLAEYIFGTIEEEDPDIDYSEILTAEVMDWYNRFSYFEACVEHKHGEAGVIFDRAHNQLRRISNEIRDVNKEYLTLNSEQVNKLSYRDRKKLARLADEVFSTLNEFTAILSNFKETMVDVEIKVKVIKA
jgi:hypothetical protein